jgi:hypothetical protein
MFVFVAPDILDGLELVGEGQKIFFVLLGLVLYFDLRVVGEGGRMRQLLTERDVVGEEVVGDGEVVVGAVVLPSQVEQDRLKVFMFLFHFLVVAPALLSLSCTQEGLHYFEDLVCTPHVFVKEVLVVDFEEPVVLFVLLVGPVSLFDVTVEGIPVLAPLFVLVGFMRLFGGSGLFVFWGGLLAIAGVKAELASTGL